MNAHMSSNARRRRPNRSFADSCRRTLLLLPLLVAGCGHATSTVSPPPPASACGGIFVLYVSPTALNSIPPTGANVTATINLGIQGPAPQSGATVAITKVDNPPSSGGPAATFPASVTVAPGECTATFTITVFSCTTNYASCTNKFKADYAGASSSATVQLPIVQ
jgi:hypothetical protein